MKRSIFAISMACYLIFTGCNSETNKTANSQENSQAQKNIAAFKTVSDAFQSGDVSKVDSVVADDFVDHTDHGDVKGRDSLKAGITMMHDNFKDMKNELVHIVADNDYVFAWMKMSGTSDGAMGMPPGPFNMSAVDVVKFNNEAKATEHWSFIDPNDMMKMMNQPMPKDSTKK